MKFQHPIVLLFVSEDERAGFMSHIGDDERFDLSWSDSNFDDTTLFNVRLSKEERDNRERVALRRRLRVHGPGALSVAEAARLKELGE
jgi:hypothetical protein